MDQMKAADPHCTKPISRREVLRLAMGSLIYTLPLRARKKEAAIAPAALALTRRLEDFVDRRQLAGVVASVTRGGRPLYRQAVGYRPREEAPDRSQHQQPDRRQWSDRRAVWRTGSQ